jgi:hypothetical protein
MLPAMKLHLDYIPKKPNFSIGHKDIVMLVGSCFAENIGRLLDDFKFNSLINPNGILFNPLSILTCLENILHNKSASDEYILERDNVYYSYFHHSSVSDTKKSALIHKINSVTHSSHDFLKKANILIITFGTAFIYQNKHLNITVTNCHKQPLQNFNKRLLKVEEIVERYSQLITHMKTLNPGLKMIFTVSPVKYLKDGVEENNLSKSTLLLAVHDIVALHPDCFYFPAYELVNDDLRDYRFYKEDLAHPNDQAIAYVWQKFSDCFFNEGTIALNSEIHKLNQALNHRPMSNSPAEINKLKDFIEKQKKAIAKAAPDLIF